jgi:hypothetical protein
VKMQGATTSPAPQLNPPRFHPAFTTLTQQTNQQHTAALTTPA